VFHLKFINTTFFSLQWKWASDLQKAFEFLRERFAQSIELVHPDSESEYVIHIDASSRDVVGVLMQED
jgi:hypothetical protein